MAAKLCHSLAFAPSFISDNHNVSETRSRCSLHPLPGESCRRSLANVHARGAGQLGLHAFWEREGRLRLNRKGRSSLPVSKKEWNRGICTTKCSANEVVKVVGSGNGGMPSQAFMLEADGSAVVPSPPSVDPEPPQHWMESAVEKLIFNCRFWTLFAVAGSLAGSFLCFLKGLLYVADAFVEYFSQCLPLSAHTGKVILLLVEAVDVFLVGTVLIIFGFGLYELFVGTVTERALGNSSLFGMFRLKVQPRWMMINSLDELKTKIGHVVIMILLVGMFEKSKKVPITNAWDLVAFSFSILVASLALLVMHMIHKI